MGYLLALLGSELQEEMVTCPTPEGKQAWGPEQISGKAWLFLGQQQGNERCSH